MRLSPAEYVIQVIGGVRATARALGKTPTAISKWKRARSKNGCGGHVPSAAQRKLLSLAKIKGWDLSPNDLAFGREII